MVNTSDDQARQEYAESITGFCLDKHTVSGQNQNFRADFSSTELFRTLALSKINDVMETQKAQSIRRPFNLKKWIEEHRHELKPPVANRNLYQDAGDYIVMIVAGPNARKDYHFNETEELYYQLEGDINVRIQENGEAVDIPIKEGEMFLLPPRVPHSPMRPAGTIGLVIELKRSEQEEDGLMWFCDKCNTKLHDTYFHLTNIEKDFIPRFKDFYTSDDKRTCPNCGNVMEVDSRFV